MRRCLGITRNLNLCNRYGDWKLFCEEHKKQPLIVLFILIFTVGGINFTTIYQWLTESKPKYAGILKAESRTLFTSEKPDFTKLEIGWTLNRRGWTIKYPGGRVGDYFGPNSEKVPFTKILDDIQLKIDEREGQIKVSLRVRNEKGDVIAKLIENEWQTAYPPKILDRNYSKDMLEVIGEKDEVLLQVRVLGDTIQLNGVFYSSEGYGMEIMPPEEGADPRVRAGMHMLGPDTPRKKIIKAIFKYPSELHLGELR